MGKGDAFWRAQERRSALKKAEESGQIADSIDVRMELIKRLEAGEITHEQVQSELRKIKRNAKASGKITREQAYRSG